MTERDLREMLDRDLAELARMVEKERERRGRGLRRVQWNTEKRTWEKREL